MKKALIILGVSLLAACGTTETKEVSKQDTGEVKTLATTEEVKEERTIELHGDKVWQRNSAEKVKMMVDDGETVYLWSDAAEFEGWVLQMIDFTPADTNARNETNHKEQIKAAHHSTNEHIKAFVYEMEKRHPDKQEYFDTLKQAGTLMEAEDLEAAKTKLSEAQTLRAN